MVRLRPRYFCDRLATVDCPQTTYSGALQNRIEERARDAEKVLKLRFRLRENIIRTKMLPEHSRLPIRTPHAITVEPKLWVLVPG